MNARRLFASDNAFGIPMLADNGIGSGSDLVPVRLVPFRTRLYSPDQGQQREGNQAQARTTGVHLFVEDYRAEAVWTRPVKSLGAVKGFGTVLSPDFSLYRDWPPAVQIWNTYRSRWVAAWWQSHGLRVVPSVAWAGPSSYSFCFLGIPQSQMLAISIIGLGRDPQAWRLFSQGFEAMLERLAPRMVLCHGGVLPTECQRLAEQSGCELKEYEPLWTGKGENRRASFYPLGWQEEPEPQVHEDAQSGSFSRPLPLSQEESQDGW